MCWNLVGLSHSKRVPDSDNTNGDGTRYCFAAIFDSCGVNVT